MTCFCFCFCFFAPGTRTPLLKSIQTEASVVLVSGDRASEHDSFNGACNAKIVTPPPSDGAHQSGGGSVATGAWAKLHTKVVDEGTAAPYLY